LLWKRKGRLNARIINESSLTPSCTAYELRFGGLDKVYELIGYKRTDTFALRGTSHIHMLELYRAMFHRLQHLFADLKAAHVNPKARPKKLRFSTGITFVVAVCPAERTPAGRERRWRFESRYAEISGLPTLMCLCDESNDKFLRYIVAPDVSHIHTVAMLKENDERLKDGIRLRHLSDLRRVVHRVSVR
jgi:hypothetical protein